MIGGPMSERRPNSRNRQQTLHRLVMQHGQVTAADLADRLGISLATVRRDLASLERRGLVDRTWGGARVRSPIRYLEDFSRAADDHAEAKRQIAAQAAMMVEVDMVVGLSGGTTCTELARWLRGAPITVVTNAINVATELYNHGRTKVIVTGGALNAYSYELVGEMASYSLQEYRLDLCFVGSSGITTDFGFSMRDHPEAAMARQFKAISERTFVVADHSKVGRRTLARFAPLGDVDGLIADDGLPAQEREALAEAGLQVLLASRLPPLETKGESPS